MDLGGLTSGGREGSCGGMLTAAIATLILFGVGLYAMNWAVSDYKAPHSSEVSSEKGALP